MKTILYILLFTFSLGSFSQTKEDVENQIHYWTNLIKNKKENKVKP